MILDLLKIDLSLGLLLFIPGYSILIALLRTRNPLGILGTLVVSMVLSLGIVDFSLILIDKIGMRLTSLTIILTLLIISFLGFVFYGIFRKKEIKAISENNSGWLIFILIVAFSIFLRLVYLVPKIIPHTTDLGHHMYWVNFIIRFQELPIYGIPDVVIGEHVIFAAASILTGIGIISALPVAILFIINIFSLLAVFLLTKELAKILFKKSSANKISLLSLISIGIFYAVASPQATYISGGVIGNLLGNLLMPTIFYLFIKAFKDKNSTLVGLGIFLLSVLIYTHHLSAFILLYSLAGFLLFFFILLGTTRFIFKKSEAKIIPFLKIFINLKTILTSLFLILFVFLIRVPSYLNLSAIGTAVGSPSKETRVGLTINNLLDSTGSWRMFYSAIGIIFLIFIFWQILKKNSAFRKIYSLKISNLSLVLAAISLPSAWFITIFAMSHWPALLKIDIISSRIANYLTYPSAILAAFGVYAILQPIFYKTRGVIALTIFMIVFIPGVISGLFDVSETYPEDGDNMKKTVQTFKGSKYLNEKTDSKQKILRDHIYLIGDTWIKNFLMRDYEEPISRTFLKKYEDPIKERETCSRDMIAIPETEVGRNCFQETGVEFLILRNGYDTYQFETSNNFSKIFTTKEVIIFQRNNL